MMAAVRPVRPVCPSSAAPGRADGRTRVSNGVSRGGRGSNWSAAWRAGGGGMRGQRLGLGIDIGFLLGLARWQQRSAPLCSLAPRRRPPSPCPDTLLSPLDGCQARVSVRNKKSALGSAWRAKKKRSGEKGATVRTRANCYLAGLFLLGADARRNTRLVAGGRAVVDLGDRASVCGARSWRFAADWNRIPPLPCF